MAPAAAVPLLAVLAPRRLRALCALGLLAGPARAADVASRVGAQSLVVGADATVSPSNAPASRQMRREHPGVEEPRGREAGAGAAGWDQVKQELQQRLQQQLTQLQYQPVEQQQKQPPQPQSEPQSLLQESQLQPAQQQVQQQELPQAQLQLQQAQQAQLRQPGYGPPVQYGQQAQYNQPPQSRPPLQYNQPPQYRQPVQYSQPPQYRQPAQYSQPVQQSQPVQYSQPVQQVQPPQNIPAPYGHPHYAPHNTVEAQKEVSDFDALASRAIVQSGLHPPGPDASTTQPCFGGGPCEDVETVEEDFTVYLCIIGVAVLAVAGYYYHSRMGEKSEESGGPQKGAAKS